MPEPYEYYWTGKSIHLENTIHKTDSVPKNLIGMPLVTVQGKSANNAGIFRVIHDQKRPIFYTLYGDELPPEFKTTLLLLGITINIL